MHQFPKLMKKAPPQHLRSELLGLKYPTSSDWRSLAETPAPSPTFGSRPPILPSAAAVTKEHPYLALQAASRGQQECGGGAQCSEKAWWTGLAGLLSHTSCCVALTSVYLGKKGRWAGAMNHRQTGRNTALPSPCRALASATNDATRNQVGNVLPAPESQRKKEKKVKSLSRVRLFATPWTVAYQAPPSMGFSRQ